MRFKTIAIVFLVAFFAISSVSGAKTDILGEGREFSVVYGDDLAVLHAGFQPIEDQILSWGFVVSAKLNPAQADARIHADEWLAGVYFEHPILNIAEITPLIPTNLAAQLVGGIETQYLFGTDQDAYFTPYIGVKAFVSKNVSVRMDWRYNSRNTLLNQNILSIGAIVEW